MENADWVLIDVETSGDSTGNYIIELGLVEMKGWKPVGRGKSWLINHDCDISWRAQSVHGISKEMLARKGMPPREAYREIVRFLDGRRYGAHGISFETRVIESDFDHYGVSKAPKPCICTLKMARMFLGHGNCGLQDLAERYRLKNKPNHRALADARATAEFAGRVLSKHVDLEDFAVLSRMSQLPMAKARELYADYQA